MTVEALKEFELSRKDAERAKNMFALGLLSWLYHRPHRGHRAVPASKFGQEAATPGGEPHALQGRLGVRRDHGAFAVSLRGRARAGTRPAYRNITGNVALAYGLVAAAHRAGCRWCSGSYPITPGLDILHTLARLKRFGVTTIQAEDEIAGIGAALGAATAARSASPTTSGPAWR
jgi:2-oxoglutarate ferredoxin oxidoreductase subunit alpha